MTTPKPSTTMQRQTTSSRFLELLSGRLVEATLSPPFRHFPYIQH